MTGPPPTREDVLLRSISSPPLIEAVRACVTSLESGSAPRSRILEEAVRLAAAVESGPAGVDAYLRAASEPEGRAFRHRVADRLRAQAIEAWARSREQHGLAEVLESLSHLEDLAAGLETEVEASAEDWKGPEGFELIVEVAHDLRSPLTSILFLAETIRSGHSGDVSELQHRQLGLIYSAALALVSIASDVVELARGGTRLSDEAPVAFSVGEILESVREMVQPMAEEKGITLRLLPPDVDHCIGFPVALSRVLLNLTTNGLKFTEDGFVEVVARKVGPSRVEFSVRDTGRGMEAEAQRSLYQPFRKASRRTGYFFSGSGLGLSIAKRLVQAMGSELRFESRTGWGTRFYFELHLPPAG